MAQQASDAWTAEDFAAAPDASEGWTAEDFDEPQAVPQKPSLLGAFGGTALEQFSTIPGAADIATQKLSSPGGRMALSAGETPEELARSQAMYSLEPELEAAAAAEPTPFRRIESGMQAGAQAIYPEAARGQGGLPEQLASGAGSIAAGALSMAAGPAAATGSLFAMGGVPLYYDIRAKTGNEKAATLGLLFGGLTAQLNQLGIDRMLGGTLAKLATGRLGEALRKSFWAETMKGVASEEFTEVAEQGLVDAFTEVMTGEDLDNLGRIKQILLPTGILGGAGGAGINLLLRAADRAGSQTSQAAPGAQQAPVAQQPAQPAPETPVEPQAAPVAEQAVEPAPPQEVGTAAETQAVRATVPGPEPTAAKATLPEPEGPRTSSADSWAGMSDAMEGKGWKFIDSEEQGALKYGGVSFPTFERGPVKVSFSRRTMVESGGDVFQQDVPLPPGHLMLDAITVDPAARGKKEASKAFAEILSAADEQGTTLILEPAPIMSLKGKKLNKEQLLDWYKRHGFEQKKPGSDRLLIRRPKEKVAADVQTQGEIATPTPGEAGVEAAAEGTVPAPEAEGEMVIESPGVTERSAEAVKNQETATKKGHVYRGMTEAEYRATIGSGKAVQSRNDFSFAGEGTNFAEDFPTASSYVNFGRDDPRKTGKPTFVVEVEGGDDLAQNRQGYFEAKSAVPRERVKRIWRIEARGKELVAVDISTKAPESGARDIGIKNRRVEQELEEMGVELPEKEKRGSFLDLHARAKQTLEKDQRAGERLVAELATEERQHTDEEGALLTMEANRLRLERKAAEEAYIQDPSEANQKRINKAREDFAKLAEVTQETGGKVGAALNIRKMMIKEDYSLAGMERAMAVAKGGELNEQELARVKELQEKLDVLEKAHKKYVTDTELKLAEAEADRAIAALQSKMKGLGRRSKRKAEIEQTKKELGETLDELGRHFGSKAAAGLGALDARTLALTVKAAVKTIKLGGQTLAQWTDAMVARFGEGIRPYIQPAWDEAQNEQRKELAEPIKARLAAGEPLSAAGNDIRKIAEGFVRQGINEREPLISAVHDVVKDADPSVSREDVRDAISGYGEFRKLTSDAAKRRLSELKGEMREVAKLEALSQGQRPEPTGFERRKPTQQELKLNDKTRQLMRDLGFTKKPGPRWNVSTINEVALEARRLASAIKARRTRLAKQISSLEERIASKDFAVKEKKIPPIEQDPEAVKLKAQYERTKKTFELEKKKAERAKRTKAQILLDAAKGTANVPRAVNFSFDLAPIFRQGKFFGVNDMIFNPARLTRQVWDSTMALSQAKADKIDAKLRSGRWNDMAEIGGLDRPTFEEEMGGAPSFVQKALAPWSRVMNTFLNLQRTAQFAALMDGISGGKPTIAQAKAAARAINILTGRGNAKGKVASAMDALGPVLSSPRLLLSNVQTMVAAPAFTRQKAIRNQIIKQYVKHIMARAVIHGLIALINKEDDEVRNEWDWRSSDFGKIMVGEKRYDLWGGMSQIANFAGRTITGENKDPTTGKIKSIRGEKKKFTDRTWSDFFKEFWRYKLAPVPAAMWDIAEGTQVERDKRGRPLPTTAGSVAKNLLLPITLKDIYSESVRQGVPATIADKLIGAFAIGVRDYSK